jgi:ATP-dependent Clp protease protease subunit
VTLIPTVIEPTGLGDRAFDIYSRLLRDRIVIVGSTIDDDVANLVIAQLLFLDAEDPAQDISMYINTPGGSLTAGLAIYDTMQYVRPPIMTICTGLAASAGSLLLAGGAAGRRMSLPHGQIMIHQPAGASEGRAIDIHIHAEEILRLRRTVAGIYARHCGRPVEQVAREIERDFFMTPEQALTWGLIDTIVDRPPKPVPPPSSPNGQRLR